MKHLKDDMLWWKAFSIMFNGRRMCVSIKYSDINTIYTDSSMTVFGALHNNDWFFGVWNGFSGLSLTHHEVPCPMQALPEIISVLELYPVLCAVHRWGKFWKNSIVHMFTDNAAVEIMLRRGKSTNKFVYANDQGNILGDFCFIILRYFHITFQARQTSFVT